MGRVRDKLTYANVVATLALLIAVGGASAFAASQLGKNSVGSKQLKKNAVITAKIKKEAVTGAKVRKGTLTGTQINSSTLGTVPNAKAAQTAQAANSLSTPEPWHVVGAPGEPDFTATWKDESGSTFERVAYFKDHEGVVHLTGVAVGGPTPENRVFQLPPGFRPPNGKILNLQTGCIGSPECEDGVGSMDIYGTGFGSADGMVQAPINSSIIKFEEITFRAES